MKGHGSRFGRGRKLAARPLMFLLVLVLLTWNAVPAHGRRGDDQLPSCDAARASYEGGKLYDVLGLKRSASAKDIKKHFKRMSVKCHPDKDRESSNAEDNFIAIAAAYETLGDETKRKEYDTYGSPNQRGGPDGGSPHRGTNDQYAWKPKQYQDVNVDDIFKSFFGGNTGGGSGKPGSFHYSFGGARPGDAGDDDFENLFRDFNFGSFGQKRRRSSADNPFGAINDIFGAAFGGLFGDQPTPPPPASPNSDFLNLANKPFTSACS
ncbi:uncharacterized protein MONBRDRAFT_5844 [Monosiga brevicollis MX1]|uniref:J domain-containing protein n=1 Tax=Monosiga brevicollis TaxID=81824 RepID=A9USM7_MONBE|nr:uncharacterized protein MONBRDRAFT_5844 [Monosiga brevicollis MX1]EDQ91807.1 predicted protein [Monosiga brevicollis MX1]|eukprot:XP_001743093.1 hypothetical protein [Monosiga brevicollis MX1]